MMTNQMLHTDHSQQMQSPQSIADYLAQLLKDRKQLAALPNVFTHLERLLDEGESRILVIVDCEDSEWMNHLVCLRVRVNGLREKNKCSACHCV